SNNGSKKIPENNPIDAVAVTTIDTEYVGILNMDKSSNGSSCLFSYFTNKTINIIPNINKLRLRGDKRSAKVDPLPSANRIDPTPIVINIKPNRSNFNAGFFSVGFKYLLQKIIPAKAKGILNKNKNGHVKNSITIPPTVGPMAGAIMAAIP